MGIFFLSKFVHQLILVGPIFVLWLACFRKGEVSGLLPGLRPVLLEGGGADGARPQEDEQEDSEAGGRGPPAPPSSPHHHSHLQQKKKG